MDIAKLKEKLKKQKEAQQHTFFTVPKKAKKEARSARQAKQRGLEEENMRGFMTRLKTMDTSDTSLGDVKAGISEYGKSVLETKVYKKEINKLWKNLPDETRLRYILSAFGNQEGVSWDRK